MQKRGDLACEVVRDVVSGAHEEGKRVRHGVARVPFRERHERRRRQAARGTGNTDRLPAFGGGAGAGRWYKQPGMCPPFAASCSVVHWQPGMRYNVASWQDRSIR